MRSSFVIYLLPIIMISNVLHAQEMVNFPEESTVNKFLYHLLDCHGRKQTLENNTTQPNDNILELITIESEEKSAAEVNGLILTEVDEENQSQHTIQSLSGKNQSLEEILAKKDIQIKILTKEAENTAQTQLRSNALNAHGAEVRRFFKRWERVIWTGGVVAAFAFGYLLPCID